MVRKRLFRCFSAPEEPRRRSGECDGARFVVMVRESCQAGTISRQRLQVDTSQLTSQPLQMRPSPTPPCSRSNDRRCSSPTLPLSVTPTLLRTERRSCLLPVGYAAVATLRGEVTVTLSTPCLSNTRYCWRRAILSASAQTRSASPSPGAGGPKRLSDHERAATAREETKRIGGGGVEQTQEGRAQQEEQACSAPESAVPLSYSCFLLLSSVDNQADPVVPVALLPESGRHSP